MRKGIFALCMATMVLITMAPAYADYINYTVAGTGPIHLPGSLKAPVGSPWGPNGYPGDTVELQSYTGTLDLTPGIYTLKINTLLWKIDYTYGGAVEPWPDMNLSIDAERGITSGSGSAALSQDGNLRVNYYNDYLSFFNGATASFVVDGFQINVTPIGLPEVGGSNFDGGNPWVQPSRDMMATFEVSSAPAPVPEPASMGILGMGLLGLVVTRIRKRQAI